MNYSLVKVGSATEPITLAEAKDQCRVSINEDDTLIYSLTIAAREAVETIMRMGLSGQTYDMYLNNWWSGDLLLPMPPLQSVTSIKYTDIDGVQTTWSSSNYYVSTAQIPGRVVLKNSVSFPTVELKEVDAIVIRFVSGYADPGHVPELLKRAMLLIVGHLYENRENVIIGQGIATMELPQGAKYLCWLAGRNLGF